MIQRKEENLDKQQFISLIDELKIVEQDNIFVFYFTAPWCGPCKRSYPIISKQLDSIDELIANNPTKYTKPIYFIKLNYDDCRELKTLLKVKSIPTMFLYVNGVKEYINNSSRDDNIIDFFNIVKSFM